MVPFPYNHIQAVWDAVNPAFKLILFWETGPWRLESYKVDYLVSNDWQMTEKMAQLTGSYENFILDEIAESAYHSCLENSMVWYFL